MKFHEVCARATAAVLLLAPPAASLSLARSPSNAVIESGAIEGSFEDGLHIFKGIPYAAPPVGELRWRAPRLAARWAGIREATEFGPACPQASSGGIGTGDMSEDCLTLNIWSPALSPQQRLPVMVWIHGGAFNSGSARMPVYDASSLAKEGVVMVSINYRLGVLGFFGHPELAAEAKWEKAPTANYGLLDQLEALRWVKRNIAGFGGDPSNVTVFGESAGGISTLALMAAPAARGLFQKAIIQSGGGRWMAPSLTQRSGRYVSAYECGEKVARAFGLGPREGIAGLRSKSWQDIEDTLSAIPELEDTTPFVDGELLPSQIGPAFAGGDVARIPIIVGANSYEGVLLRKAVHVSTEEVLNAVGPKLGELSSLYPPQLIMTPGFLADHIWGDANFVEPARMIARHVSGMGQAVYHYSFDFQTPALRVFGGGTPHGLDVAYALGNLKRVMPFPLAEFMHRHNFEVSQLMMFYWTNFAKTGNPNGFGAMAWPRFALGDEETLVFSNDGAIVQRDYLKRRLDLVSSAAWRY